MADKSEFVDMISEATSQARRRVMPRAVKAKVKETSQLSHWPPDRWQQWRLETLTPWKIKRWKFKNWDRG
jgi:hypothetical protein